MKSNELILRITRLVKERMDMPFNGGDTPEEAEKIDKRKAAIKRKVKKLKEELLFNQYMELQSKEFKENFINWTSFKDPKKEVCIRVNFTWGYLKVYRTKAGTIEWY